MAARVMAAPLHAYMCSCIASCVVIGCGAVRVIPELTLWEVAVDTFADRISAALGTEILDIPTVALTIAGGKHYVPRYAELLVHYQQIAQVPFAVIALDNETHNYFASNGVPSMFFDIVGLGVTNVVEYRKEGRIIHGESIKREAVMRGKFETTAALLERGIRVVLSEIDVYWKKNPLTLLTGADLLMEQHDYNRRGEVNIGFYIAEPTGDTLRVFNNVKRWLNMFGRGLEWCGTWDQRVFDFALRCRSSHPILKNCNVSDAEQRTLCDTMSGGKYSDGPGWPVNWDFIPWESVPHPPLHLHVQDTSSPEMSRFLRALDGAVAAHFWSGFAVHKYQMRFAYEHGFWAPSAPPPPATGASGGLWADPAFREEESFCEEFA